MSYNVPFDIQAEIIKRIPDVKSLIRFRSVSKPWKSLIDSSRFIADYRSKHHHLLVSYFDVEDNNEQKLVSIVDDDSFPQHKFPLTHVPMSVKQLNLSTIVGSSQGLFMFFDVTCNTTGPSDFTTVTAVVWNPSIRKSVSIDVPHVLEEEFLFNTVVGFGVRPHTNDLMLVKIIFSCGYGNIITSIPWQVEVFTLSSGVWRSPLCINSLPRNKIEFTMNQVVIDGFIYWKAYDTSVLNDELMALQMVMSFDMTTEEFTEIYLPEETFFDLFISKLRESLIVFAPNFVPNKREYCVWMMEGSVTKSFTKLYTIITPKTSIQRVLGFRKGGEPIIVIQKDAEHEAIFVYKSDSQPINDIGIYGETYKCLAKSYMESLLLLDQ